MNILGELLGGQNNQVLKQLSQQFGLGEQDTRNAMASLLPSISNGLKRNMATTEGAGALLEALERGQHSRYLDNPEILAKAKATKDGNGILGHLFGNKKTSRKIASKASAATGLSSGLLKKMLPVVAGLAMGALGKQAKSSGMFGQQTSRRAPATSSLGGLSSFLDMDNDGSVADDLLKLATKFFF